MSILDYIGAKDGDGGGDNWSYETCKVKLSLPLDRCSALYALLVTQPTVSKH